MPQDSVLGPILFIIYIMQARAEDTEIRLFAEDTIIYTTRISISEVENKLQKALHKMEDWLNGNYLKINTDKTKGMLIRGTRKMVPLKLEVKTRDGTEIDIVDTMKYLGVMTDDRLLFKQHCEYIKKVGKKISFLNRTENFVSAYVQCTIYKTIIGPHFEYCSTVMIHIWVRGR